MTDPFEVLTEAFNADVVDVKAANHDGHPAIVFYFGVGDYRAPGIVLDRPGFTQLADRIQEAILQALAHDGDMR